MSRRAIAHAVYEVGNPDVRIPNTLPNVCPRSQRVPILIHDAVTRKRSARDGFERRLIPTHLNRISVRMSSGQDPERLAKWAQLVSSASRTSRTSPYTAITALSNAWFTAFTFLKPTTLRPLNRRPRPRGCYRIHSRPLAVVFLPLFYPRCVH